MGDILAGLAESLFKAALVGFALAIVALYAGLLDG